MVIGHWWFNYHPGLVEQDLRMRLEMTGDRFIPFNSDARVLENLIPKWQRFRDILAKVLTEKYQDLHDARPASDPRRHRPNPPDPLRAQPLFPTLLGRHL